MTNIYTIYECFCVVDSQLALWPTDLRYYAFRSKDPGISKFLFVCDTRNLKMSHENCHLLKFLLCTYHNVLNFSEAMPTKYSIIT
jgi:hypothetical protein